MVICIITVFRIASCKPKWPSYQVGNLLWLKVKLLDLQQQWNGKLLFFASFGPRTGFWEPLHTTFFINIRIVISSSITPLHRYHLLMTFTKEFSVSTILGQSSSKMADNPTTTQLHERKLLLLVKTVIYYLLRSRSFAFFSKIYCNYIELALFRIVNSPRKLVLEVFMNSRAEHHLKKWMFLLCILCLRNDRNISSSR